MKVAKELRYKARLAMGKQPVIQFGIPRSGSTLVFNLLRELLPTPFFVAKTHALRPRDLELPIVATYRNPLDVMASVFESHQLEATDNEVRKQLFLLSKHGLCDVFELRDRPNALLLCYETFLGDFDFLFNEIARFFGLEIDGNTRMTLSERYDIKRVKQSIDPDQDFSHHDRHTGFHGRHVSKYEGGSGYHAEIFTPGQIDYMKRYFRFFMEEMNYQEASGNTFREAD